MAERVKDDDSREVNKARQRSKEVMQGPQPKPKGWQKPPVSRAPAVQGPQPRPQVPDSFKPLQSWKKPETEKEKLQSWAAPSRPLTKEDSKTAFSQWVSFKQKEAQARAASAPPDVLRGPYEAPPRREVTPPLQLTRPSVNTSAPPISASGTVGAQTQTVRRQPPQPATPDVLRGNYERPVQPSYNVPERPVAAGVSLTPQPLTWAQDWANQRMVEQGRTPDNTTWGEIFKDTPRSMDEWEASQTAKYAQLTDRYKNSGAVAWGDFRSDRRHALADASDEELQQQSREVVGNVVTPLLTGGLPNPQDVWKLGRGAITGNKVASAIADTAADFGSGVMDWFDNIALEPGAFINTEPMQEGGTSPAMWFGGGYQAMMDRTDDDTPSWLKFVLGWAGALAGAAGAVGINPASDPQFTSDLHQNVQQGIELVNKIRALPPEQQRQASVAIPNLISGTNNAQLTYDFIVNRSSEVAKLRQQAAQQKQYGNDLAAAQLGAQANQMENLHIADIKEMHEDPAMEFFVGLLLDPLNLLDAPLGLAGDIAKGIGAARRLGTGVDNAVDLASAVRHIDDALAQADDLMTQVATTGAVDLRNLKGRPAAETFSKGITKVFGKTKETLVQARTEQVYNAMTQMIPPGVTASDAKAIVQAYANDPKSLITGLPAEMFTSPILTNDYNVNGLVKWGNGVVAPKFLSEYYPVFKSVADEILKMPALNHTGALDHAQFIGSLDDIIMGQSRRLYGMSDLPTNIPAGTSKIEVRRVQNPPVKRGQKKLPPSQDAELIYKDSSGAEIGRSNAMPMSAAQKQRDELQKAALASGTTGGARIAANIGNILTLRPILTDMYLGLRPANWVKNAASAYATMFADGVGSFRPLSEIESYLETKMGPLFGNQRTAQAIEGGGPLRTQFGVVEGPHWAEKIFGKNNRYSRLAKGSLNIPYGNKGITVGNMQLPVGEQNFYARIFQSAFERGFNPHMAGVNRRLVQAWNLDPQLAGQVEGYLNDVARSGTKADWLRAVKQIGGGKPIPPTLSAVGIPPGVLSPAGEKTVMEAIASGDLATAEAAILADLKKQTDVIKQAPAQGGVSIPTETAIVNEAEDIEDLARMAGQDASELVSNYVQTRRAIYQPLINDLDTADSSIQAADIITAYMGGTRKLQERLWQRINDANAMAMEAAQNTLGSTSSIHAQRWEMVQQEIAKYLQEFQTFTNGFRSRLAAGDIAADVTTGRKIFDELVAAPEGVRPTVANTLEYGDPAYQAVINANKAIRDKAYLSMWDAARRNPSMMALDMMQAADDRVGDIYRALAADVEDYKRWLRSLGDADYPEEWAKFRAERDAAYGEAHNIATSVYDSARAGIVGQAAGGTTYKYRNATYRIIGQTPDGWRLQKVGDDSTLLVPAGDKIAPPPAVARKWQEAQGEIMQAPAPQAASVVDDRLPEGIEAPTPKPAPYPRTAPIGSGDGNIVSVTHRPEAVPAPTTPANPNTMTKDQLAANFPPFVRNNLTEPWQGTAPALGTWAIDPDLPSMPWLYQYQRVPLDKIEFSEVIEPTSTNVDLYTQWAKEGKTPPGPMVKYFSDTGQYQTTNNRRVYAAKAAGQEYIDAWVFVQRPDWSKVSYGDADWKLVSDPPVVAKAAPVPVGLGRGAEPIAAPPSRAIDELRKAASDAGLATATKDGKPMDNRLLNSINKHGAEIGIDRKITRLDELTDEEAAKVVAYYQGRTDKAKLPPVETPKVEPTQTGVVGNKTQAWSDPNNPIDFQYEVVEYDDLNVSNLTGGQVNPRYPKELQPRDRTQAASRLQVDNIAKNLQPRELLSDTTSISNGSPIVNASNVVESGNGRMMALGISPKYADYKAQLVANASKYGIDPAAVEGMNRPVLVRRRLSGEDSVAFATAANARTTLSMNAVEQGRVVASKIPANVLQRYFDGGGTLANINTSAGSDFARSIINLLPQNERAAYLSPTGTLTTQGKDFISSVLFSSVFTDDSVLRNYVLAVDPDLRNIGNGFETAIVDLATLEKANPDLAIGQELSDAANTLIRLRETGQSVDEFLAQGSMFETRSPEFEAILRYMDDNIRSGARIGNALRDYVRRAMEYNPNQVSMFADATPAGKLDLLNRSLQSSTPPQTLFGGFGFTPPDDWFSGWHQLSARGAQNMGQTAPQMGDAASHAARELTDAWKKLRQYGGQVPTIPFTPEQQMRVLDSTADASKMWDDAISYSQYMANKAADYAMLNFNDKRNIDTIMGMVMPYSYFWSRSALNWAKRLARKPSLLNFYYEVQRDRERANNMNEIENQGLPARVEDRFPALGQWFMGNPLNMFLPINSYMANEFVDPEVATNQWEKWYMKLKQHTPVGGIGLDVGLAALFDAIDPRGEGAQPRLADVGIGDYAPILRQVTSAVQGATGYISPSWLSGDPYAYGTSGRAVATNLDVDPTMRKWALDVGTQLLKGLPPLPEQPDEAAAIWTEAAKQAGWDDAQAKFMAFILGLPFAKVTQDERTMRADQQERRGLGYNGGVNATGSKAAVDAFDAQTGDAATLLAQYPELYPSNTASNPDAIDFGRPGEAAARDMRGGELDALEKAREAEINAYIQANWGKETDELYAGVNAINDKYEKQEAAIKANYPSVESGDFNPTASYYRNHSPEELQAAAEEAAQFATKEQVGDKPVYPGDNASREAKAAYYAAKEAWDKAYQNALAAALADPDKLSGYVAGMPTQAAPNPAQRAQEIISDTSWMPEQQQRLAKRSAAEKAESAAERQQIFDQYGEDIYDLQDQYFALPEGSQARRDFVAANPQLKAYWEFRRGQEGEEAPIPSSKGLRGSSTQAEYKAKRAEAETLFGASIWDVVDGYDKNWSQPEKSAYLREHPELLAFWDYWYGEREQSSSGGRTYRQPFVRRGPPSNGPYHPPFEAPQLPNMPGVGGGGGNVPPTFDPRWAQYQAQAWQPGNWQPSRRRENLRDIPLASLRSWA